jgi:phytoene dehydrogenase-like protein
MAEAVADRLRHLGGKIISAAEVGAIEVSSRKVTGLRLRSGEVLPAGLVIGAVHPKIILDMLPAGAVKPSYRQRISGLRNTHGIFSVHARIDGRTHPELPYNLFKISTDSAGNVPDLKYYQIRRSSRKDVSVLSILTSGKSELWQPWENTRTGRRGRAYLDSKEEHARQLLREAEDMLGNFQDLRILDAYTPLSMRDWVGSPGGSAYGVQRSSSQMLATALLNRTAVQGLYLAGQNVMAPGIIGTITGSFHTTKLILGAAEFRRQVQL